MSDFFTTFAGDLPPWLLLLIVPLYFWGKTVKAGLDPSNKASFECTIRWLCEEHIGQLYLSALGGLMDGVGQLIGDRHKMGQSYTTTTKSTGLTTKLFGFNPFTPESYEKCILLAFIYPMLSFLFAWMVGGNGYIGDIDFLSINPPLGNTQRSTLLLLALCLITGSIWLILKYSGWRQWICLAVLLGFLSSASSFYTNEGFIETYRGLVFIFSSAFNPIYLGGVLTGFIFYRSISKAHKIIYRPTLAIAFITVVTFSCIMGIPGVFDGTAIPGTILGVVFTTFTIALIAATAVFAVVVGTGAGTAFVAAIVIAVFAFAAAVADFASASLATADLDTFAALTVIDSAALTAFDTLIASATATDIFVITATIGALFVVLQATQTWYQQKSRQFLYLLLYTIILLTLGVYTLYMVKTEYFMAVLLLWLLLPLVNAPLDWLSLGVTRGLLQAVRSAKHSTHTVLAWAVMDLVLALVFLFLITAVLVGVTALGNTIAGKTLVDIHSILAGIKDAPAAVDHLWIYFMLLSTLVPTLIHFALAGGAATLWLPRKIRLKIADGLEHDSYKTQLAWVYLTFTPVVGFILMPAALLYGLYWIITVNGAGIGWMLFDWAQSLADFAGGVSSTGKPSP